MKSILRIITTVFLLVSMVYSQDNDTQFTASGKPFIKVFTNYHSTFSDNNTFNAFEIQRAYLGYSFKLNKQFSGRVTLDVGDPGIGKFQATAFLKNAYFQFKQNSFTTKFGLFGLTQFKLQEKQWGGRYLYKSFQDQHKFGSSADLGIYVAYKLNKALNFDASIINGNGYKSIESDSIFKYTVGITLTPIKKLDIRAYYDFMGNDVTQKTLSLYAGYAIANIKVGAEYNQQFNHRMKDKDDLTGLSFYASYKIKNIRIFGRYDKLSSNKIGSDKIVWNYEKDGEKIIAGIEFSPIKGIKLAPNYQSWIPASGETTTHEAYLSCEIKF